MIKTEEKQYDSKGREIVKVVQKDNYTINFVRTGNEEKDLSSLYKCIAELLYEEAIS